MTIAHSTPRVLRQALTGLFALATGAFTLSALADSTAATQSRVTSTGAAAIVVHYGDLDLNTDAGSARLYRRIASAARQVCPDEFSRDLATVAASQKCQAVAIATAVQDVHSPMLAQVYAARTRHG